MAAGAAVSIAANIAEGFGNLGTASVPQGYAAAVEEDLRKLSKNKQ